MHCREWCRRWRRRRRAEDIVQDVALRLFSKAVDYSPINNIGGFVYSSIRNRIIDLMRTKKDTVNEDGDFETQWAEFAELFYSEASNNYPENEALIMARRWHVPYCY